jgi:4-amino-4-deoxy-L-arabinose transferase-like glycosyltransferase
MKNKIILTIIFTIAVFFRFWQLTQYPVSLSMDEVAIGWNANSILKTGHDEWGEFLPLAFQSAGDYKPPVNIYLTVPSIALFGFNEFAVRFPSALIGSLTPIFLVLLLLKLKVKPTAAYLTGLWLAVLPWHIHFSRASFEAITALFFLIAGTYYYLSWVEKPKLSKILLWITFFSLSVWAYHAERLFVPILVLGLIFITHRQINFSKVKSQIIIGLIVLSIFALPFIKLTFFTPAIMTRAAVTSILRDPSLNTILHHGTYLNTKQLIFDNDIYLIFRHWLGKYLNYFNFEFIFWNGLQLTKPGYPGSGLLYFIDLPLIALGVFHLIRKKDTYLKKIVLFLFLLGPLPASFTMNEQHPLRALVWIPAFALIMANGYEKLLTLKNKKILFPLYFFILIINIFYFVDIYKYQFPKHFSEYWQYGYKEIAQYSCKNINKYNEIIISETFGSDGPLNTGLPYLYVLFYCQADPKNFMETKSIDKFSFHRITWRVDSAKPNRLLIAAPWDFLDTDIPENQIIKKINFLNGKPAFLFVATKNE